MDDHNKSQSNGNATTVDPIITLTNAEIHFLSIQKVIAYRQVITLVALLKDSQLTKNIVAMYQYHSLY